MRFFFSKNKRAKGRIFRPFVLLAVFMLAGYGFWVNNNKRMETIVLAGMFTDESGTVSKDDKATVLSYLRDFKKRFGTPLTVAVLTRPPQLGRHEAGRIYLDIMPEQRLALLTLPPIIRRAAGPTFPQEVEDAFARGFAEGTWQKDILPAVIIIRNKMTELSQ